MSFNYTVIDQLRMLEESKVLGINIATVHTKLFTAVSDEIRDDVEEISTTATAGFTSTKEVLSDVATISRTLSRDLVAMLRRLQLEKLQDIDSSVKMLLTSLQAAVARPSTVFPRFVCGEIPVDPARLANLQKRHCRVQRLNAEDSNLRETDRSMPNPPKSGLDVITNVTSSLEIFADEVLVSADSIAKLSRDFDKLKTTANELALTHKPMVELLKQQEVIKDTMSLMSTVFQDNDDNASSHYPQDADVAQKPNNIIVGIENAAVMIDKIKDVGKSMHTTVEKIHEASEKFSSMSAHVHEFFTGAINCLSEFVESIRRLHANLARITRELHQFFMPMGLKALVLRPSDALLSILQSIEDIKNCMSEPQNIASSAIDELSKGESTQQIEAVRDKLEEIQLIPRQLYELVENVDFQKKIVGAVELQVSKLVDEFASNTVGGAMTDFLGTVRADLPSQLGYQFNFGTTKHSSEKDEESDQWGALKWKVSLPWGNGCSPASAG